jgi:hypothetical protein
VLLPLIEHLHAFQMAHPDTAYGQYVALFKERGARAAYEIGRNPKMAQMAAELKTREAVFAAQGGVAGVQQAQNSTLANQALRSWADVKTIVMDLGQTTVPGLTLAFKGLNAVLESIRGFLGGHPTAAAGIGYGATAAAAVAGVGLASKVLGVSGRGVRALLPFGRAAGAAAGGGAAASGLVAGGALTAATGVVPLIAGGLPGLAATVGAGILLGAEAKKIADGLVPPSTAPAPAWARSLNDLIKPVLQSILPQSLLPSAGVRPPMMQGSAVGAGGGVFGGLLAKLEAMPGAVASAIATALQHGLSLVGDVSLHGDVSLNAPGFAGAVGKMIAQGVAHASSGLSGSGARPSQLGFVGPT